MPTLQVLVTTMHDCDLSRYRTMNLQSDTFFANQADGYGYCREEIDGHTVEQLTTATRGISKNRNLALSCASPAAEYLMFSDDDLTFYDGYEKLILEEFEKHPEADGIRFNLKDVSVDDGIRCRIKQIKKFGKATKRNCGGFGVIALVMKQACLRKANVRFNECFGPGSENYAGEDSIFLQDLLKKKLRLYFSPVTIGELCTVGSTWFTGHDEKYYTVNGKVTCANHPILAYILPFLIAYRHRKKGVTTLGYFTVVRCFFRGVREYKSKK